MTPFHADDQVTLWHGDTLQVLRELPDASIDCCVTSPPYFGLRDYGQDGQYGLEGSPAEYVETMRAVFFEVRRLLAEDGTLWLNLGDSYSGPWGGQGLTEETAGFHRSIVTAGKYRKQPSNTGTIKPGAPPAKNLMGMPWRVAFALQDDGWILRNEVIWSKPNGMPSSVTDRLSLKHEHVFLFSKARHYHFDLDAVRVPYEGDRDISRRTRSGAVNKTNSVKRPWEEAHPLGRNPGDVWEIATQPFPEAHFAVMPLALAERCIAAGCKTGGTVLDPFSGSGTTGLAAARRGHRYVGIDLSSEYLGLSLRTRLGQAGLLDGGAA